MDIKLICDSLCDIPEEISKKDYIEVVPLTLYFQGKEYKDGVDIKKEEFYELVQNSKEIPKTSQATYAQFKDVFQCAINENKKVLCITGASSASGTYQSAVLAKNDLDGEIEVFDTEQLSLGAGQFVIRACDFIEEGQNLKEIVENLENLKDGVKIIFAPATFDYLKKSGRVMLTTAVIGNILNIKPIFAMERGKVKVVSKARGIKKLVTKMIDMLIDKHGLDLSNVTVTLGHGCNLDDFQKLKDEVEKKLKNKVKRILVTKGGVCICSHTGPDVIAISFSK